MLASAAKILGREVTLADLFALVGRKAEVDASDSGCSGERIAWSEEATIIRLLPPRRTPVYDQEYGTYSHMVTEPVFDLSGMGRAVYTRLLSRMRLVSENV